MARRRGRDEKLWLQPAYGAVVTVPAATQVDTLLIDEGAWVFMGTDECVPLRTVGQVFPFTAAATSTPLSAAIRVAMFNENTGLPLNPGDIATSDGVEGQSLLAIRHMYTTSLAAGAYPIQNANPWWSIWDCGVQRRLRRPMTEVFTLQNRAGVGGPDITVQIWLRTLVRVL